MELSMSVSMDIFLTFHRGFMSTILFHKVNSLPAILEPSCAYFVKDSGTGNLTIHITDHVGSLSYSTVDNSDVLNIINQFLNTSLRVMLRESNPVFTWSNDKISRIDYSSGSFKLLSYNPNDTLAVVVSTNAFYTITKTFNYNVDGTINSITQIVS